MAKLKPPNNVKLTKMHYEWLAWSVRRIEANRLGCGTAELATLHQDHMASVAMDWAEECRGTNPSFKRDRFISAVVNGEW